MSRSITNTCSKQIQRYTSVKQQLKMLDYRKTLERGYILVKKEGKFMTSSTMLDPSNNVELLFHDGVLPAVISQVKQL